MSDNVSAISTALGAAGVAVIRISGDSPLKIAEKMFKPTGKTAVCDFVPNFMYTGEIDCGNFTDFGMCVYFKAPKSFTGEDVVEFHCHGGTAITKGVLNQTLKLGARLATKGEFTKRAFINGKLSLSSCEGLIDMINSESEGAVKAGFYLYREKLTKTVEEMQTILLDAISELDADMDFPEEDISTLSITETIKKLQIVRDRINQLLSTFKSGRVVKNGVKVALIGKPNTGKSSILNALLNDEKAIVSNVAGTTRDIVEGAVDINGVRFNLFDTAGIRESKDEIESIGVNLSKKALNSSDLILFITDGEEFNNLDSEIWSIVKDKNYIFVQNKIDKNPTLDKRADISVSALTGERIEDLKQVIYNNVIDKVDLASDYLCEERHYLAMQTAVEKINVALVNAEIKTSDLLAIEVKEAWDVLGEITGKTATEEIINNIFSKFCVGK
ncbi:MAG: tRNA uridine-5-carboxymethylaminomethyl(34) synthesis GTPase MnmE [Clostridia bacterium]|nr:tRNA uridine-5-carboxymethylaminomethyl(34) synthesis GTPase MnmE [Clostridia bacterium]